VDLRQKIVEHNDRVAFAVKLPRELAADETSTAGNQDPIGSHSVETWNVKSE
jgi:hypothetical protein